MTKDYNQFKTIVKRATELAGAEVDQTLILKGWKRESPYQKRRYKPEYVYPEVWVYREGSKVGAVLNGEDIEDCPEKLAGIIIDYLF